jgi:hypothetical protein
MNCPKCNAAISLSEVGTPTRGEIAKAILLDWRVWVIAFVVMMLSSFVANAIGTPSAGGIGGGAAIGVLIAIRMGKLRACPSCKAVIPVELPKTA